MTTIDLASAVKAGADWLDDYCPGWEESVCPDRVFGWATADNVLAQVFGRSFQDGVDIAFDVGAFTKDTAGVWLTAHGFWTPSMEQEPNLAHLWAAHVRQRMAANMKVLP